MRVVFRFEVGKMVPDWVLGVETRPLHPECSLISFFPERSRFAAGNPCVWLLGGLGCAGAAVPVLRCL